LTDPTIGIIGAGAISQQHATQLTELGETVDAVADIDDEARESFGVTYDVPATYEGYEAMLADVDLDIVLVAVPNALHAECTIAALELGCNVLVEKPMARTLDEAESIVAAERESEGTVMVGFTMTFSPAVEAVTERVHDGELGDVFEVDCRLVRRRGIPQLGSWFTQKDLAGGGALIDAGVHLLGVTVDMLDSPDVQSVSARTGAHFGNDPEEYTYLDMWAGDPVDDPTFDVDDSVRGLVRFADGTTLALDVTWASNREPERRVHVLGDGAGATIPIHGGNPTIYSTERDELTDIELQVQDDDPIRNEWSYFLSVVRGEREHIKNTADDGLTVQRIIDGTYRSSEQGQEVRF
jgi:predicted dehydrogenase